MRTWLLLLGMTVFAGCGAGEVAAPDATGDGSDDLSPPQVCGDYASPNAQSDCTCASGHTCSANGCYDGKWCHTTTKRCVLASTATPSCSGGSSGSSTSGSSTGGSSGATGVGIHGGTVDRLYFAAVGDSRPPGIDDTSHYPSTIITRIYQDISARSPEFVVGTGDYMFASPSGSRGKDQLAMYLSARSAYSGVLFPAMGNHECTGYTASNCASPGGNQNYQAFVSGLLAPIQQTRPYYRFDVNDSHGTWTAKFIVLAMNAWDSAQGDWLETQLSDATTYTFIIRHEPEAATTAPGVTPSDDIIRRHPYTMKIVGHTHEFYREGTRQVIVGNGGAPLARTTQTYGYAMFEQLPNGDIQVSNIDYNSNEAVETFVVPR